MNTPVFEYADAIVGDETPAQEYVVAPARIAKYVAASGDNNPLYTDADAARRLGFRDTLVPLAVTKVLPRMRRHSLMKQRGFVHPIRPTAFARWEHQLFAPIRPGDVITATTRLAEKYEKRGRQYLVFEVVGRNQRGEKVVEYRHTSLWSGTKPEDRTR